MRQLLLLGLLLDGKKHGYQLNEYFKHTLSLCADMKKSTAYYILNKLEKDGYVVQETERQGNRPERRVYELTEMGRSLFYELLRQNLGDFSQTYYDDDIGIAFMDQLPINEARQLLETKRDKLLAVLNQFNQVPAHEGSWRFVIDHNITHLEAEVSWLERVLQELSNVQ